MGEKKKEEQRSLPKLTDLNIDKYCENVKQEKKGTDDVIHFTSSLNIKVICSKINNGNNNTVSDNSLMVEEEKEKEKFRNEISRLFFHKELNVMEEEYDLYVFIIHSSLLNPNREGHWAILLFCCDDENFYYYDSIPHYCYKEALYVINILLDFGFTISNQCNVIIPNFFPKQMDNWECGYFVIVTSYLICTFSHPLSKAEIQSSLDLYTLSNFKKIYESIINFQQC